MAAAGFVRAALVTVTFFAVVFVAVFLAVAFFAAAFAAVVFLASAFLVVVFAAFLAAPVVAEALIDVCFEGALLLAARAAEEALLLPRALSAAFPAGRAEARRPDAGFVVEVARGVAARAVAEDAFLAAMVCSS